MNLAQAIRKARQEYESAKPQPYHVRRGKELMQEEGYFPQPHIHDLPQEDYDWRDHEEI